MDPVNLTELGRVALLDRTDTKFVLDHERLARVLSEVSQTYRVLEVDGVRLNRYQTVYFDTPDLALYRRHHDGYAARHKVRSRTYVDSGLAFLEVKQRNNRGRTLKHRLQTEGLVRDLDQPALDFLAAYAPPEARLLQPVLENDFTRITLTDASLTERVTLDTNVRFSSDELGTGLPGVAIVEVKQAKRDYRSPFMLALRAARVQPSSVSKYCTGVALLNPTVKRGEFAEKLRHLDRLSQPRLQPFS
jgi:hypothetical protein